MKGGILEVLLVNAEGIKHTNLIGKPRYYVILQCGDQTHKSKTSVGKNEKSFWNEKFKFKFSFLEWRKLSYLKLRIMDKEIFSEGGFVGETLVHLGGILTEGNDKGFIEVQPSLYNVVLEDDTYKGEIKIGFKFTANVEVQKKTRVCTELNKQKPESIYGTLFSFWRIPWLKFFFPYKKTSSMDDQKLF
ncbi:elicitor-responsive protein 3 [Macadamia integrifolia]|uniref:elicitor-responsive protein 3 n=1 Tax=Macadamia integrifolia TaxID=60698 RepID=UPI001C4E9F8E|nr:elicitor-responsive protein 3 [Macadamia integrifolia]